jgi:perosamine synthetase
VRETFLPFGRPNFGPEEEAAIVRTLRSGWIGMGPEVIAFEKEMAEHIGVPHVVTVNSCTSALFLSLLVQGVGPGDEVIVPSMTWCSTANAALFLGARAVICDVDPETLCATWEDIEARITPKTKAVIAVHYGGLAAETKRIRERLPKHIALIEDAAHAFGTLHPDGTVVGSDGNLTCFSFYANKNLSTGEGGAVALREPELADRIRSLRLHALHSDAWKRFTNRQIFDMGLTELGYKMNYTDMQACIGRVQLRRQPEFNERRFRIVSRYLRELPRIMPEIRFQSGLANAGHVAHLFVVKLPVETLTVTRDEFLLMLRERNIGAAVHYAPLHTMPLYSQTGPQAALPKVESVAERLLTMPISSSMTDHDVDDVIDAFAGVTAKVLVPQRSVRPAAHTAARV